MGSGWVGGMITLTGEYVVQEYYVMGYTWIWSSEAVDMI